MEHQAPYLLIDADVLAYQAATAVERVVCWENEICVPFATLGDALNDFDRRVNQACRALDASPDRITLCFSCPTEENFRKRLYPQYKANRAGKPRPVALVFLRDAIMKKEYPRHCVRLPGLEADDVLGILATDPSYMPEFRKIVVSVDKDMKTIPCEFFDLNKGWDETGRAVVQKVTAEVADQWFLTQALTGDTADGYPGCPGYGPVKAMKLFENVLEEQRGRHKKAVSVLWPVVVEAYHKVGFGREYALTQARLARILRSGEYNMKNGRPRLWQPPKQGARHDK